MVKRILLDGHNLGNFYRGKINSHVNGAESRDVTVKIWNEERELLYEQADCNAMFHEEVAFLRDPTVNHHPNLVKFIGYCSGRVKGVVYDVNPVDTLHNLTTKDLIDPAQSGFVKRRRIVDNIFLTQELMRGYHKNSPTRKCAMKVDIMKAYDNASKMQRESWRGLLEVV